MKLASTLTVAAMIAAPAALMAGTTGTPHATNAADTVGRTTATISAAAAGASQWSPPAVLSACPSTGPAQVVFPSDSPSHGTGAGAVVWSASANCSAGAGARVAPIGVGDTPGAASAPLAAGGRRIALGGPLAVTGAPDGKIVIAGSSQWAHAHALLIQGAAGGPFTPLASVAGADDPLALTSAYLGDTAFVSSPTLGSNAGAVGVRLERHFSRTFGPGLVASAGERRPVGALALALDYRCDALAVWAQDGSLYARDMPTSGVTHQIQRLAPVGSNLRIAALLSDDNRAIVAWSDQHGTQTSVYLDQSATGVRFGAPTLLERFTDPDDLSAPAGSPSLIRLSSESVMMAWAGSAEGRWVVRTAAIDGHGPGPAATIDTPGVDALLEGLTPGPDGDALTVWTEPQQAEGGLPDLERQAIFAARGINAYPGRTIFGQPEEVAPPGFNSDVSVALDPDSDRALAVWRGASTGIEYSIGAGAPGG